MDEWINERINEDTISVPKSIQRIVIVPRGRGIEARINRRNGVISGTLDVRV